MAPKTQTLTYKTVGNLDIQIDVHTPANAHKAPVLLFFHGGGLLQGNRWTPAPHLLRSVEKYNVVLVSADYRLAPQVGVADILEDVKDCIAYIRNDLAQHIGADAVDTSRLAVSGGSAGGYLALLAGLYVEPKPQVVLAIYPITDPLGTFFTTKQPPPFGNKVPDAATLKEFLDPSAETMAYSDGKGARDTMYFHMLDQANLAQLLKVEPGDDTFRIARKIYERGLPPTYVVHGDADGAVGVEQADEVVGVMAGLGIPFVYDRPHGVDHLFDKAESEDMGKMYDFMQKYL